ncbi:MAG: hypothetical protein UY63_C0017G0055 [Parcubacteria group bacterium GW2011_GWA2_51_10]|nr:MAG: hypothetical protein UY63_C0017G0055 [Parcubacteria group bacterium GW2011_GWA2_51_10]
MARPVLVIGLFLVALQYMLAWQFGWLTTAQMQVQFPQGPVLPLAWHFGIHSDFVLTFVLAYIVAKHGSEWTMEHWAIALFVAAVVSVALHVFVYAAGTIPEAHVQGGRVTSVGWVHALYAVGAFAILALFYIAATHPTKWELIGISTYLVVHVWLSCHFIPALFLKDYTREALTSSFGWLALAGTAALVTLLSWWRWPAE